MRPIRYCPIFILAFALAACGHDGATGREGAGAAQPQATPASTAPAVAPQASPAAEADANGPLQVDDLDAYARGMQKEIAMRQSASERAAKAKAANDQEAELNALGELTSVGVETAGAQAAGVTRTRYGVIKAAIDHVLGAASMNRAMADMQGAARLPQADPYAGLATDVAAALKARATELDKLRADNLAILMNARNL